MRHPENGAMRYAVLRALGTQAVVLPEAIAKPIEPSGRPGHRTIGRRRVHVQTQLIGHGEYYESGE